MAEEKNTDKEVKDEHVCGEKCEIMSRVTGYYRPIDNWNIGKRQEFRDRKHFNVGTCVTNSTCCGDN